MYMYMYMYTCDTSNTDKMALQVVVRIFSMPGDVGELSDSNVIEQFSENGQFQPEVIGGA
jgi:hypothetical protein